MNEPGDPLFGYSVTPSVVPRTTDGNNPVVVDLQISVYNPLSGGHPDASIRFTIPPDLTPTPETIAPSAAEGTEWNITPSADAPNVFVADPINPQIGLDARQTIAFMLTNIRVATRPGLAMIEVCETTNLDRETSFGVTVNSSGLGITHLAADRVQVTPEDNSSRLAWTSTAETCTVSWAGGSSPILQGNDSYDVFPEETTTYILTASSGGLAIQQPVTVNVARAHILSFGATPYQIALGSSTDVAWTVVHAQEVTLWDEDRVIPYQSNPQRETPADSTTYFLTATGPGGPVSAPAPLQVMSVVIDDFSASPGAMPPGGTAQLNWATRWTSGRSIDPAPLGGTIGERGTAPVAPASSTTYTLSTTGKNAKRATTTVTVGLALVKMSLTADPSNTLWIAFEATKGSTSSWTDGGGGVLGMGSSGEFGLEWPWRLPGTLLIQGWGQSSRVELSPSPWGFDPPPPFTASAVCPSGLDLPGMPATFRWSVDHASLTGSLDGEIETPIWGYSGSVPFTTGTGDGWSWQARLAFDPDGPKALFWEVYYDRSVEERGTAGRTST